jgi:hypothetical protein
MLLQPGESRSFNVRFTPSSNHSVSSLLIVRYALFPSDLTPKKRGSIPTWNTLYATFL